MKKIFLCVLLLATMFLCSSASALTLPTTMDGWYFNPYGAGYSDSRTFQLDGFTLLGLTLNNSTPTDNSDPGNGTFITYGAIDTTGFKFDSGTVSGTGITNDYQITGILETSGTYSRENPTDPNTLNFNNGSLNFYMDGDLNYGTTTAMFGADDGDHIASFNLIEGEGTMDFTNEVSGASGTTDLLFQSTFLRSGTWFDVDGNDLSLSPYAFILGISDSNNQVKENPNSNAVTEFPANSSLHYEDGLTDFEFFVETDGSFEIKAVLIPEPATLFLFGSGLLALAGIVRRRKY